MSILIKGMEMPNNCQECACINDEYFYCQAVGRQPQDENIISRRPDWCPLIEVPPHGRLVDESWLKKAMITTLEALKKNPKMDGQEMHLIAAFDTLRAMVEDAPTVIEAEEET